MFSARFFALFLLITLLVWATPRAVSAQSAEPPSNAPIQAGPLILAPIVRLANVGHDSNVYNRSDGENPVGDVTAVLSPSVDGWLRMAHARANGRARLDAYYFKQLTDLRAIDNDSSGHIEVPLNRIMVYATGSFSSTRHRQNLEIDALARRRIDTITAGMDVRLTARATAGFFTRRAVLRYQPNSLYRDTDLSRVLNHESLGGGVEVRYALTPLTTIGVTTELSRDHFDIASDRDSNNSTVVANVQFNPRALISGGVAFGVQKHHVPTGAAPDFNGSIAAADLTYTFLGRTRFAGTLRRQLEYSYLANTDYVNGGVGLSVMQRLGEAWEIGGTVSRDRLSYRRNSSSAITGAALAFTDETVLQTSGTIRYNLGHTQLGFDVEHRQRAADQAVALRGYQRLRIGSTLTYVF